MASQTLIQRLGSSFWQAFSGTSSAPHHPRLHPTSSSSFSSGVSSNSTASMPAWDADKVRRVLEGTAVVRVVDVELPPTPATQGSKTGEAAVKAAVAKEAKEVQTQAQPACVNLCACARETGLGVLEESMRALTLGKK
jgi:bZIP-type transcription factor MBZ1